MEEESTKMVWVVFVLAILALDVADCQDYSWDGVAAAGVPRTFYRFGPGIDNLMYPEDDGTTGVFVLPTAFPFFGTDQYYLSISANGALVFGDDTIFRYSTNGPNFGGWGYPLVTPFYNDIDTSSNGEIYFRISQDPIDLNRISAAVKRSSLSIGEFAATYCVIATWSGVTYFNGGQTAPVSTFQAVLATDGEMSFVVFNYGDIGWGQISEYSTVGFFPGPGGTIVYLPLSGTAGVMTIGESCEPFGEGTYLYQVDGDTHVTASCANKDCEISECAFCCVCKDGFSGNGDVCSDNDECDADNDDCDTNAFCNNTIGSFSCQCKPGYTGDGKTCTDLNECNDARTCNENAECENTEGSFTCQCKLGYTGDGQICTRVEPCSSQPCEPNGVCINEAVDFRCSCTDGYEGRTCQAPPLASLDATFNGFYGRIRLSTPSFEDTLTQDFEQVHDAIRSRFGQQVESSRTLRVWKAADGSSIVDIEVVLLDSEGITEDDVMGVITSAFPFTGLGGSRYTIDPKRIEVMFSRASSTDTGATVTSSTTTTATPVTRTTNTGTYNYLAIGLLAAVAAIAIVISIILCICIGSGQRAVGPGPQYFPQPSFGPPFRMPVMRRPLGPPPGRF